MRAYERLLNYVLIDTASDETADCCPTTPGQRALGEQLVREMTEMGMSRVRMDKNGYVTGRLPATAQGFPKIGLIAHMDTVNCVPASPVRVRIIENYDGGAVRLESGDLLDPAVFPELALRRGKRLIVTDGRTLLGGDDKAGIAEILTACENLLESGAPHGEVIVGFTPDEEIGRGADRFDVKAFGADFAYTVDGDAVGGIEYENFNAASARLSFHGVSTHPGSAKNRMRNAALLATEFQSMLPAQETPEHTEGYEGFYHLIGISGEVETAHAGYILRDHDEKGFEARKRTMRRITDYLNEKYGPGTVELVLRDSYFNMRSRMEGHMDVVRRAEAACRAAGVEPFTKPIRGGTDGAMLTFKGLICPNLGTGVMNYHGRFECVAVEDMDAVAEILRFILTLSM